jgi:hypothetical protein
MTDEQFMAYAVNNLTNKNDILIDIFGHRIGHKIDHLTINELRDKFNLCYEHIGPRKVDSTGSSDEEVN